jgi:hypothetical protein
MIPYNPNLHVVPLNILPPNPANPITPNVPPMRSQMYGANVWDNCLSRDLSQWMNLLACGGIEHNYPGGRGYYQTPPWISMPPDGRRFRPIGSQPLSAFQVPGPGFNGLDTIVLQERVPLGYDGVITEIIFEFTGTGFVDGSGDISWRLASDYLVDPAGTGGRFLRDHGNVQVSIGSFQFPSPIPRGGLRVYSWDLVSVYAAVAPAAAIANGNIIAGISGWYWPR